MANPSQKFDTVERTWAQTHPNYDSVWEVMAYIKKVVARKPFKTMLEESAPDRDSGIGMDVEFATYVPCGPRIIRVDTKRGVEETVLFSLNEQRVTTLDVLHRLAHYSLNQFGYSGKASHELAFAQRYLELVYRFYEPTASPARKREVKALMVANNIKTHEKSEEAKEAAKVRALRKDYPTYAAQLRESLARLREQ